MLSVDRSRTLLIPIGPPSLTLCLPPRNAQVASIDTGAGRITFTRPITVAQVVEDALGNASGLSVAPMHSQVHLSTSRSSKHVLNAHMYAHMLLFAWYVHDASLNFHVHQRQSAMYACVSCCKNVTLTFCSITSG